LERNLEEIVMTLLLNILGIIVVIGGLYLFSENKNKVNKKLIAKALKLKQV
jgi:CNT family concentrative nucleoside transporter